MIAPKGRAKAKANPIDVDKPVIKINLSLTKSKPIDADKPAIKSNLKSPNLKHIILLSNQTLQIKLPEDYKTCKIELF